jgi:hypothetical protein
MSIITTPKQKQDRLDICNKCEYKITYMSIDACGKCNCPLGGKTTLAYANCPDNRWPILNSK